MVNIGSLRPGPIVVNAQFAPKLQCLFQPKRYKILYGGRGAGRSWGAGRALALIGTKQPIRVLCVRELQNSIAESVHKLLSDQINLLGLSSFYEIQRDKIIGANGTTFSFEGIKTSPAKVKSYEGINYCWVEEANKVSKTSWEILVPTIREAGSEIWATFNPELEKDDTYQRFVVNPQGQIIRTDNGVTETTDSFVVKMNFHDNPWFPEVLWREAEHCRRTDQEAYDNIWLGNCRTSLVGAVFAKELRRASEENRITKVPYATDVPVDVFFDLGHRDATAIWLAQRVAMQWRILKYYEATQEHIPHYMRWLQAQEYVYGTVYLPHDARHSRLGQKRTIEQQVRSNGFRVQVVPKAARKANPINAARSIFQSCWFDERECAEGLQRLRHYTYEVKDGQFSDEPLHDENSNGADAFMTLAQAMRGPKQKNKLGHKLERSPSPFVEDAPSLGWLG